jgi:hypothetical protein
MSTSRSTAVPTSTLGAPSVPAPHFVQDQLGHHDPKFTASVYGHLIPGDRRGEVDFLDGLGGSAEALAGV